MGHYLTAIFTNKEPREDIIEDIVLPYVIGDYDELKDKEIFDYYQTDCPYLFCFQTNEGLKNWIALDKLNREKIEELSFAIGQYGEFLGKELYDPNWVQDILEIMKNYNYIYLIDVHQ